MWLLAAAGVDAASQFLDVGIVGAVALVEAGVVVHLYRQITKLQAEKFTIFKEVAEANKANADAFREVTAQQTATAEMFRQTIDLLRATQLRGKDDP